MRMATETLADFLKGPRGKLIGRVGLGLGGLGAVMAAGQELQNPNESKLSNIVGAGGNLAGGLGGMAAGGALAAAALGATAAAPIAIPVAAVLGSTIGAGALGGLGRAAVSLWEDPTAMALRAEKAKRDFERQAGLEDLQARMPYEIKAAEAKAAIQAQIDARAAALKAESDLQQGMINSMLTRTQGQNQQNALLTQGLMQYALG
jgi:hypothetical protein